LLFLSTVAFIFCWVVFNYYKVGWSSWLRNNWIINWNTDLMSLWYGIRITFSLSQWLFIIYRTNIFHFIITFMNLWYVTNAFTNHIVLTCSFHLLNGLVWNTTFIWTNWNIGTHVVSVCEVGRYFRNYFLSNVFHSECIITLIKHLDWIQLCTKSYTCVGINRFDKCHYFSI
jgi:hypothetical protein